MSRILVIENSTEVRETFSAILEDQGHEVLLAEDGASGIAAYRASNPDLVITDIVMPNKTGLDAIRAILAIADAKIIATTGDARNGVDVLLKAARALGAVAVLPKPFGIDELMQCVNFCLPPARM